MRDGYSIRPATREDFPGIAALIEVADKTDYGRVTFTIEDLDETWDLPRFEPTTDSWLVTDLTDAAVGYGWLWFRHEPDDISAFGLVHPAHRRRGLGSTLAAVVEERVRSIAARAPEGTAVMFRQAIPGNDATVRSLFENMGYTAARHFIRMEITLEPAYPAPGPPEGIEIRNVRGVDEAPVVHAVLDEAMVDHWNYQPEPYDDFVQHRLKDPDFGLWFLALEGGEPAGALIGKIMNGLGWVGQLGVRKPFRRRGIGDALLGHAFAAFAARGLPGAELQVDADSETGATALYERAGMRRAFFWTFVEKRLA